MQFQSIDWKKGIVLGSIAGAVWGWIAMGVNAISGAFPFEFSLIHNLFTFVVGGAIFGIVASGFLSLLQGWLPFKGSVSKAVYITTILWIILFLGGYLLAVVNPERYAFEIHQGIQGLILAAVLGFFLGILWDRFGREESAS